MKLLIKFCSLIAIIAMSSTFFSTARSEILFRMHGSNTVGAELGPAFATQYLRQKLGATQVRYVASPKAQEGQVIGDTPSGTVSIEIQAHGSSTSFRDLQAGKADIGMSSRPIKNKELLNLKSLGISRHPNSENVIGLDGIAVIVSKQNQLNSLSIEQLAAIFSGKIRSWRELGINLGTIHVYARDNKSGTYDTFKNLVLGKKIKLSLNAKRYESNAVLSDDVSADPAAIGFVGLPYIRHSKAIKISAGQSKARMPTVFNVATEDYALSRRLFMYVPDNTSNQHVKDFVSMVHSTSSQNVVRKIGFISQNVTAIDSRVGNAYPDEYQNYVKNAKRLSVNFRFLENTLSLDSRAKRDLDRVAEYLNSNKSISKVMLFGFSEDSYIPIHNISLSESRADTVERELSKRRVTVHHVRGYGAFENVADNTLKDKNRRVEVWIK